MNVKLQRLQLLGMQRVALPAMERERALLAGHRTRGRPPLRPIVAPTKDRLARVADEPRMALAFALRRLEGMGYDRAAIETAAEFRAIGKAKRPGVAVERAWTSWREVVVPQLIAWLPDHANRLRDLLRERQA